MYIYTPIFFAEYVYMYNVYSLSMFFESISSYALARMRSEVYSSLSVCVFQWCLQKMIELQVHLMLPISFKWYFLGFKFCEFAK